MKSNIQYHPQIIYEILQNLNKRTKGMLPTHYQCVKNLGKLMTRSICLQHVLSLLALWELKVKQNMDNHSFLAFSKSEALHPIFLVRWRLPVFKQSQSFILFRLLFLWRESRETLSSHIRRRKTLSSHIRDVKEKRKVVAQKFTIIN